MAIADRQAMRQTIRAERKALSAATAQQFSRQLASNARNCRYLKNCRHVAGFLPADGEMDPLPLMQQLWSRGKRIYLPVLVPFNNVQLWFARFEPGDELVVNRFGILEPVRRDLIKPAALDLVLTPLVAFDVHGHRIGMGGGFYDRSFAFLKRRTCWRRPRLLGIAYELQRQSAFKVDHWDIPLDAIVTEEQLYNVQA